MNFFPELKVSCSLSNINHCKSLNANVRPSVKTRSNVDQSIVKKGQRIPSPKNLTWWPWQSIGFQIFLWTKYVPSLVKILWNMLILQCSQGCYMLKIRPCDLDLWPWKSIGFHWRMLILVFSRMLCGIFFLTWWPLILKINILLMCTSSY